MGSPAAPSAPVRLVAPRPRSKAHTEKVFFFLKKNSHKTTQNPPFSFTNTTFFFVGLLLAAL
jgi:hypothetical protein